MNWTALGPAPITNGQTPGQQYETVNRGASWRPISTPGGNGWNVSSNIDSVATTSADNNTIYASAGGHLFVTFDDGLSWQRRDIPGATDHFQDLQVDPNDPLTAYAVRDRFGGGHVFMTTDGGLDWTDVSGNLPDLPAYTLALDSGTGNLYVGMDDGVYVSTDQGNTWSPFGAGLPHAQVRQLEFNADLQILAAGTHGRGLWEILVPPPDGPPARDLPLANHGATMHGRFQPFAIGAVAMDQATTHVLVSGRYLQGGGSPSAGTSVDIGGGVFAGLGSVNADLPNAGEPDAGKPGIPAAFTVKGHYPRVVAGTLRNRGDGPDPGDDFYLFPVDWTVSGGSNIG